MVAFFIWCVEETRDCYFELSRRGLEIHYLFPLTRLADILNSKIERWVRGKVMTEI
jgi:hypothetical protein